MEDWIILALSWGGFLLLFGIFFIFNKTRSQINSDRHDVQTEQQANSEMNERISESLDKIKLEFSDFKNQYYHNQDLQKKLVQDVSKFNVDLEKIKSQNEDKNRDLKNLNDDFKRFYGENSVFSDHQKNDLYNFAQKIESIKESLQNYATNNQGLKEEIADLNKIFNSNYHRGETGEMTLDWILNQLFGNNPDVIKKKFKLKNGKIPDILLVYRDNYIPIDSKFPYQNFMKLCEPEIKKDPDQHKKIKRTFCNNLKQHVQKISEDYISKNNNSDQAIMYLPSQPIFELVHKDESFKKLLDLAHRSSVWITGPTALPLLLKTLLILFGREKTVANAQKIVNNLNKLKENFKEYSKEWSKFDTKWTQVTNEKEKISKVSKEISHQFDEIVSLKKLPDEKDSQKTLATIKSTENDSIQESTQSTNSVESIDSSSSVESPNSSDSAENSSSSEEPTDSSNSLNSKEDSLSSTKSTESSEQEVIESETNVQNFSEKKSN